MMMMICAEAFLYFAIIISIYGYDAFQVSIHTDISLPVIGEDFTLVCTFKPNTWNRQVIWAKGSNDTVASHSCQPYPHCTESIPHPSKFSLFADSCSGNLTITNLTRDDESKYNCTVSGTHGPANRGLTSRHVTPLQPVSPDLLWLTDVGSSRYYRYDANIMVFSGEPYNITCKSNGARPPAELEWRIPDDATVVLWDQYDVMLGSRYISLKTVTITPSAKDQGKSLRCEALHPQLQNILQRSVHLSVHVISNPPSWFFVDQNQTTSSTLFVAWQPGFDDGLQQNFTLTYCSNDTQLQKDKCGVVTNITGTSYRLIGLNPFTWYRMTLWAVHSAGDGSAADTVEASTTPLQPESYGITTSWDKQKHILTLSKANQTLKEICFIRQRTYQGPDCASVNQAECVEPGTEFSIDPDDDSVLVTFGRGLCSKPVDLTYSPDEKQPSTERSLPFMIIALGVTASVGFILLISLGLMHFYGVLCCVKRNKADSGTNTIPKGQMVEEEDYAEVPEEPPHHASKSTTSYYINMEPISRTNNDDHVSPSFHRRELEAMYVNTDMTYENGLHRDTYSQEYARPSTSRKSSAAVYANTDDKASKDEYGDPHYVNTLPTA